MITVSDTLEYLRGRYIRISRQVPNGTPGPGLHEMTLQAFLRGKNSIQLKTVLQIEAWCNKHDAILEERKQAACAQ